MEDNKKLTISVSETAKLLSISRPKAYELARSEGFLSFQVGGRILVSAAGLQSWIDKMAAGRKAV